MTRRRVLALGALTATVAALVGPAVPALAAPAPGPAVRVVVRGTGPDLAPLERLVARSGGTVRQRLALVDAVSATVPASRLAALRSAPGVREVTEDATVTLAAKGPYVPTDDPHSMVSLTKAVGARQGWGAGSTGAGVTVALIDSGVARVPGIDGRKLVDGPDLTAEAADLATAHVDTYGHGTHLAGIIAGHDASAPSAALAAGDATSFLGVAPDARLVSVKVADKSGTSDVSQVIAGIAWVVAHAGDRGMNIKVLNLSFGTDAAQPYVLDPLAYAVEQAWRRGIVVVVSAGNTGDTARGLTDPASDPFVVAVGAADTSEGGGPTTVAPFSAVGDGTRNPDVLAPGTHVPSLRVPGSTVDRLYGTTATVGDRYFRGSGTSQSAAVVSGMAALLLQAHPSLTPDQVKAVLVGSASALPGVPATLQGAGLAQLPAVWRSPGPAFQRFARSTGGGSLEAARGSRHVVVRTAQGERTVQGEQDVLGRPVVTGDEAGAGSAAWGTTDWEPSASASPSYRSASPSSSAWASSAWASSAWASSAWASSAWASSAWASSAWASSAWASSAWASSAWASSAWASSAWASSAWASSAWASSAWASSAWQ